MENKLSGVRQDDLMVVWGNICSTHSAYITSVARDKSINANFCGEYNKKKKKILLQLNKITYCHRYDNKRNVNA